MNRENRPNSRNKRHHALLLLYLRLSAFGRIIVAGLGKRAIQFTLALFCSCFQEMRWPIIGNISQSRWQE